MAGRVARDVEHPEWPDLAALADGLIDRTERVPRPIQEDTDLERKSPERPLG